MVKTKLKAVSFKTIFRKIISNFCPGHLRDKYKEYKNFLLLLSILSNDRIISLDDFIVCSKRFEIILRVFTI